MLDFLKIIKTVDDRKHTVTISPDFKYYGVKDIMFKGHFFYAIYDEETHLWYTDPMKVIFLIDQELYKAADECEGKYLGWTVKVQTMNSDRTKNWKRFLEYCKSSADNYKWLDRKVSFAGQDLSRSDYASCRVDYNLANIPTPAYDEIMSTLYSEEDRQKLEWAIGAILTGEAAKIQKFIVLYGPPGTGKSTILNIIEWLFKGYYTAFNAKQLVSSNNRFALAPFINNPIVAIQHDGDLSKVEDNTILNSITGHDTMMMEVKFGGTYMMKFSPFLFMASNKPVQITDSKAGIYRRLIDVKPTGNLISPPDRYDELMNTIELSELGGIAYHCIELFNSMGRHYYNKYRPQEMMERTNVLFNFLNDNYEYIVENGGGISLKEAWDMYKAYCDEAGYKYIINRATFRDQMKDYFTDYYDRIRMGGGNRPRNYFSGFKTEKFNRITLDYKKPDKPKSWIEFKAQESLLDSMLIEQPAQYANTKGTPSSEWKNVTTKLRDIDTKKLHFVRVPVEHIVIDFDLKDSNGEKSLERNLEAASKWPKTYAELSKSGKGIHLHYIYTGGDPEELSRVYDDNIEVKVYSGLSSLRRQLTQCNNIPVASISGLKKREQKMINFTVIKNERMLRQMIAKAIRKEHHGATKPECDFIKMILDKAYEQGLNYDVSDLRPNVLEFALNSSHNSEYCVDLISEMKFTSEQPSENLPDEGDPDANLVFYDVEVYPNLFIVCYKLAGENNPVVRLINPTPSELLPLLKMRLVGFNNRRYDNHIMYARAAYGWSNEQLFHLSQSIIDADKGSKNNVLFQEAYNLSYTDIYDFASAGNKKSLKKFEIELGIHHQEMELPWDQPVPEELWDKVCDYCCNDVIATEAVFNHLSGDWLARKILAAITGLSVNNTTNKLTTKLIFGDERKPQLVYTDFTTGKQYGDFDPEISKRYPNKFPEYKWEYGKNMYHGYNVGRGGLVLANPGMYGRAITLDIVSMHPHSAQALQAFGKHTQKFIDLMNARVYIKHGDFESAGKLFDGKLKPYLTDKASAKALSGALKTAINSVYGLTSATFTNEFRDERNVNNIVALRGALFMYDLYQEVTAKGYTVVHIKTDSIKIADYDQEIVDYCMKRAEYYGYEFEVEAIWEKICLVNNAVLIGKLAEDSPECNGKKPGEWVAVGKEFAVPYVYKTLFSHEEITDADKQVVIACNSALYLDFNEKLADGEHDYKFVGKIGSFIPVKDGVDGAELFRDAGEGSYAYASGCKGYRWKEYEVIMEDINSQIDMRYYTHLVDEALKHINEYGDANTFVL